MPASFTFSVDGSNIPFTHQFKFLEDPIIEAFEHPFTITQLVLPDIFLGPAMTSDFMRHFFVMQNKINKIMSQHHFISCRNSPFCLPYLYFRITYYFVIATFIRSSGGTPVIFKGKYFEHLNSAQLIVYLPDAGNKTGVS